MKKQFIFFAILSTCLFFSCRKEDSKLLVANNFFSQERRLGDNTTSAINPYKYLATLTFDGTDYFDSGETVFPVSFNFNTAQDANNDGQNNVEDNLENIIRFSIGNNLYGTGRTGLANRGPNNQNPALYFHLATAGVYKVYEYWLYYADNNWLNDHEHDWEKYFVYEKNGTPVYIKLSAHIWFTTYSWNTLTKDNGHAKLAVDGGSHAMKTTLEDGVCIRYNGSITKNNGNLLTGNNQTIAWTVYSNDNNAANVTSYTQTPNIFYYGDPYYKTNSNEWGDGNPAPWMRTEWNNPPAP